MLVVLNIEGHKHCKGDARYHFIVYFGGQKIANYSWNPNGIPSEENLK